MADQIRDRLNRMSKDDLLKFIENKGNARKQALYEIAHFQTSDWHRTQATQNNMEQQLAAMKQDQNEFKNKLNEKHSLSNEESQKTNELRSQINAKEAELTKARAAGTSSDSYRAACRTFETQVTPLLIKNLNKTLENDSPAQLIPILERFVSLLRNKANTKPEDCELFFADAAKLVSKMSKTETTSCSLELVEEVSAELNKMSNSVGDNSEFDITPYICFLEWSKNFCEAAKIDLKIFNMEKTLKKMKLEVELANLRCARYDTLFNDTQQLGFDNFYVESIANLETRINEMTGIVVTDSNQAMECQKKLNGFEKKYFEEYIRISRETN